MIKIGFLLYPQCITTGLFAGLDFFKAANIVNGQDIFEVKLVGLKKTALKCAHNQEVIPEIEISKFKPEIIVIPGFWSYSSEETLNILNRNQELQKFLNGISEQTVIWSYCSGVIFHALTNRLRGKTATATWWLAEDLMKKFPSVHWQFNKVFVRSRNNFTASGANGFYPLYESAIERFAGKKTLEDVQKYLMPPPSPKANDPFLQLELLSPSSLRLLKLKKLVNNTSFRDLDVDSIANRLGLSKKSLARCLKKDLNWTPAKYFRMLKYKQAGDLLISTDLSIKEICVKLGFDDESNFRRGFKTSVQMTASQFRQKFKR